MKFTNYLKDIQNVSIYPVFSLVLFTLVFIGVVIYTYSSGKDEMQDRANIPMK
jgi:cbb3-type cytochrome oxidase subunit 3